MNLEILSDRHFVAFAVAFIAGLGAMISTLEWIYNRRQLANGGLYDWEVVGSRRFAFGTGLRARLARGLLQYRPYLTVLEVRLGAVAILPLAIWIGNSVFVIAILMPAVLTTLLMNLRSIYGMDGSDQMTTQIYVALLLGYISGTQLGLTVALWYIALQACLSYFTSGVAKAISPEWRQGTCTFRIFNTRTYGYEPVARLLRDRPRLTRLLDWSAFLVEMAFPLALVLGFPLVLLFVAWGVAFHIMNAVVMGLNSFFWAFTATYPAVIYVSVMIANSHA
jgi:hypothetical protein